MDIPSISPTSTKAEILYAFNKLRSLIDSQKQTKDMPFRARVISALEDIETTLAQKTEEIVQLEKQMGQLTNKLDLGKKAVLTQETLQNLQDRIIMEEKGWERRKRQLEQELKEEAEFAKKRLQKELDEKKWMVTLDENHKKKLFDEEEAEFRKKINDYKLLQQQLSEFPEKLELEIKKAVEQTEQRLKQEFDNEQKTIKQEYSANIKLLEQKIEALVNRSKEYQNEIAVLQKQLSDATQQLKQIAVAALRRDTNSTQTS